MSPWLSRRLSVELDLRLDCARSVDESNVSSSLGLAFEAILGSKQQKNAPELLGQSNLQTLSKPISTLRQGIFETLDIAENELSANASNFGVESQSAGAKSLN